MERALEEIQVKRISVTRDRRTENGSPEMAEEFSGALPCSQMGLEEYRAVFRVVHKEYRYRWPQPSLHRSPILGEGIEKLEPVGKVCDKAIGVGETMCIHGTKSTRPFA